MATPLTFALLSDTHIGPSESFELKGIRTAARARAVVRAIQGLHQQPAFVAHLGDIVADPDGQSYALAREIFAPLGPNFCCVAGNHDRPEDVSSMISFSSPREFLRGPSAVSYAFSFSEHRFVVLDARETSSPWNGALAEDQFEFITREIAARPSSLTVFLHYPARSLSVPWTDARMMLTNGDALHAILKAAPAGTVRGVFSGHIHRTIGVIDEGILYQGIPATSVSMNVQPGILEPSFLSESTPMFTLVRFEEGRLIVAHHQSS